LEFSQLKNTTAQKYTTRLLQPMDAERLYPCTNCGMVPIPCDIALGKIRSLSAGAALVRNSM